jgi:phosphoglycolate phosphatase
MSERQRLSEALDGRHLLVDFDGPFCSVFAGLTAPEVSERLLRRLADAGHVLAQGWADEGDPLALLRQIADEAPSFVPDADAALAELETEAAQVARPNPEMDAVLEAAERTGRSVIVVSNNAGRAIDAYLAKHEMADRVNGVIGRVPGDPSSMKPSPRLLLDAMHAGMPSDYVFIGDAVRDVEAGHAAGVPTIGYANKPRKEEPLALAGAVVVVTSLIRVVEAMTSGETVRDIT